MNLPPARSSILHGAVPGAAALVAVGVDAFGILLAGGRPLRPGSPAVSVVDHYVAADRRILVQAACIAVAMMLLLTFAAGLRETVARAGGDVGALSLFQTAVVSLVGIELVRAVVLAAVSQRATELAPQTVAVMHDVTQMITPISAVPVAAGLGAIAAASWHADVARWFSRGAAVVGVLWLLSVARLFTTSDTVWAGSTVVFVSYATFVVAVSVALLRDRLALSGRAGSSRDQQFFAGTAER